ncbi:MAG: hypothetical protein ACR2P5_00535 [Gammaproteobacteria bacterium]
MAIPWGVIVPIITAALGTGVQVAAQSSANRRQREAIAASVAGQRQRQGEIDTAVQEQVRALGPDARQERQETAGDQIQTRLSDALSSAQATGPSRVGPSVQGRVSADATARAGAASQRQAVDANALIRLLSTVNAPFRAREQEGFDAADLNSRIALLSNFARGQAGADQLAIQQAGQPNPFLTNTGAFLRGVAPATGGLFEGEVPPDTVQPAGLQPSGATTFGISPTPQVTRTPLGPAARTFAASTPQVSARRLF